MPSPHSRDPTFLRVLHQEVGGALYALDGQLAELSQLVARLGWSEALEVSGGRRDASAIAEFVT